MKADPIYWLAHFLVYWFARIYGHCEVVGLNKLPKEGPVIVTPNHVSYLDPPLIGSLIPRAAAFMGRHDLWESKRVRWLLPHLNAFPVERGKPDRGAIRRALDFLSKGYVLVMFPEGGRSEDGNLHKAEAGVALIVQKSGAPVVPAVVIGPEKMLPVGQRRLRRTKLKVVFGDRLYFTPDSSREEVLRAIMHEIAALLTANGVPTTAIEDAEPAQV